MDDISKSNLIRGRKFLIVDDHKNIRVTLRMALEAEGAKVDEAENCSVAKQKFGRLSDEIDLPYDVIFLDIRLPDGSGLDLLKILSEANHASQVIMISGEGTVTDAFQATQMGAFDYVEKPFAPERIIVSAGRCIDFNRLQSEAFKGQEILGTSAAIREVINMIRRVAPTNSRVLIQGESGTGKELVARGIHRFSSRADRALVKVNCAAIPHSLIESELFGHEKGAFTGAVKARKGVFERADGGTLFLDEIGELDLDVQAKLLRALQNGEICRVGSEKTIHVDVRLLGATNRDLHEMVQDGKFREDLYYRLNVVSINVPALRERREDIPLLISHFIKESCDEHSIGERSFSDKALKTLAEYHWPGNIRELRNVVERAVILSEDAIIDQVDGLSKLAATQPEASKSGATSLPQTLDLDRVDDGSDFGFNCQILPWQEFHHHSGREYLKYILRKSKGNVSEAARMLCLERAYLHRLMKKLGIQRDIVVSD